MRGTIKQRGKDKNGKPSGPWTIILDVGRDPSTGKRRQKWETVRGTKKQAQERLTELLNDLNTGEYVASSSGTLGDFLGRWLRELPHQPARPH